MAVFKRKKSVRDSTRDSSHLFDDDSHGRNASPSVPSEVVWYRRATHHPARNAGASDSIGPVRHGRTDFVPISEPYPLKKSSSVRSVRSHRERAVSDVHWANTAALGNLFLGETERSARDVRVSLPDTVIDLTGVDNDTPMTDAYGNSHALSNHADPTIPGRFQSNINATSERISHPDHRQILARQIEVSTSNASKPYSSHQRQLSLASRLDSNPKSKVPSVRLGDNKDSPIVISPPLTERAVTKEEPWCDGDYLFMIMFLFLHNISSLAITKEIYRFDGSRNGMYKNFEDFCHQSLGRVRTVIEYLGNKKYTKGQAQDVVLSMTRTVSFNGWDGPMIRRAREFASEATTAERRETAKARAALSTWRRENKGRDPSSKAKSAVEILAFRGLVNEAKELEETERNRVHNVEVLVERLMEFQQTGKVNGIGVK